MNRHRTALRLAPVVLAGVAASTALLEGQVPGGWVAGSIFKNPTSSQIGGILLSHPRTGSIVPVSGLGPDLTGAGTSGVQQGANTIARRPSDEALIVGELAPTSQPTLDIHVVTLSGTSVVSDLRHALGAVVGHTVNGFFITYASVDQLVLLPDERVLFVARGVQHPTLGILSLGILDPISGVIASVPITPLPPGTTNAVAVNTSGTTAYVGMFNSPSPGLSTIYRVPLPNGGAATPITTLGGSILQLATENAGTLLAGLDNVAGLWRIDPATGVANPASPTLGCCNALVVERATGNHIALAGCPVPGAYLVTSGGGSTLLWPPPVGYDQTTPSGMALHDDPETFGAPTPGIDTYAWVLPNPGGLPLLGNAGFSVTVASTGTLAAGLWIVSSGRLVPPVTLALPNAVQFDVDVFTAPFVTLGLAGGTNQATLPLPIPLDPSLSQRTAYFQTLHVEASGLIAASNGLGVTAIG